MIGGSSGWTVRTSEASSSPERGHLTISCACSCGSTRSGTSAGPTSRSTRVRNGSGATTRWLRVPSLCSISPIKRRKTSRSIPCPSSSWVASPSIAAAGARIGQGDTRRCPQAFSRSRRQARGARRRGRRDRRNCKVVLPEVRFRPAPGQPAPPLSFHRDDRSVDLEILILSPRIVSWPRRGHRRTVRRHGSVDFFVAAPAPRVDYASTLTEHDRSSPRDGVSSMNMPVTTTFTIEGYRIDRYVGVVRGIIVRSPTIFQGLMGGLKSVAGGADRGLYADVRTGATACV